MLGTYREIDGGLCVCVCVCVDGAGGKGAESRNWIKRPCTLDCYLASNGD